MDLDQIQRWMQAIISHPLGVRVGLESADARQHADVCDAELESVITRSRALDSVGRLEVYANAYYARLLECLREEFPVLTGTIGQDVFDELAFGFLQQYPSRSYTLNHLADRFPQYLTETRPERDGDGPDWADLLVDLAMLELTFSEVFDGPGAENLPLLQAKDLEALGPDRWPQSVLTPVSCLRLVTLRFALNPYYTAMRQGEAPDLPVAEPSYMAISRRNYIVRRHVLTVGQFHLLSALLRGDRVGDAISQVAESGSVNLDTFADDLHAWFQTWTSEGFFEAVHTPNVESGNSDD